MNIAIAQSGGPTCAINASLVGVFKQGLLTELRAREFYEKPTAERKRKKAAAVKRHYKRVRSMQLPKKLY